MIIRILLINISFNNVLPPLKIPFYALVTFWLHFRKKSSLCNYSVLDTSFCTFLKFCPFLENISKPNIIPTIKTVSAIIRKNHSIFV